MKAASRHASVIDILKRNANDWISSERLSELNKSKSTIDEIVTEFRSAGADIEERWHQDQYKKIKFYRFVNKKIGDKGDWRCSNCYETVSAAFADSMIKTLSEKIREGYCPKCGKKRYFNPA